jgi:hypothetical protein
MDKISEKMYEALSLKYRSEMAEAEATLLVYFTNSVGIGEHPQHLEEMDRFVDKMANAKGKLEMLETIYKYNVKRNDKFEITEDMLKVLNEQKEEEKNGN